MRSNAKFPIHGPGARTVALAALAGFSSACVSGGGSPPPTGAYAEAMIAGLSGGWVRQLVGRQSVRTRVYWDARRLALEHLVHSDAQVREVLEIVDGRLQMTRTVRVLRASVSPFVLRYDRAEEG